MPIDDGLRTGVVFIETGGRHRGLQVLYRGFRRRDPSFDIGDAALPGFGVLPDPPRLGVRLLLVLVGGLRRVRLSDIRSPMSDVG